MAYPQTNPQSQLKQLNQPVGPPPPYMEQPPAYSHQVPMQLPHPSQSYPQNQPYPQPGPGGAPQAVVVQGQPCRTEAERDEARRHQRRVKMGMSIGLHAAGVPGAFIISRVVSRAMSAGDEIEGPSRSERRAARKEERRERKECRRESRRQTRDGFR